MGDVTLSAADYGGLQSLLFAALVLTVLAAVLPLFSSDKDKPK